MKGVDRAELNHATIVAYALVRALFDELDAPAKHRVLERALTYLPPKPDPADGQPVDVMMWVEAHQRLKTLNAS